MKLCKALLMAGALLTGGNLFATETVDSAFTIQGPVGKLSMRLQMEKPAKGEKIPMVIMCHGLGGSKNGPIFEDMTADALKDGMGVVRFDFNGHGESDGEFVNMDAINIQEDLRKVIAWTLRQPYTKNVSLVGVSLGGIVVGMVAPEYTPEQLNGIALLAAGGVAPDLMLMGNFYGFQFDPWNPPDYIELGNGKRLGKNYIVTMRDLPIYQTARKYYGPALVFNGLKDKIVPYTYAMRYNEVMPMAELRLLKDETHMFNVTQKKTAQDVITWFKNQQQD